MQIPFAPSARSTVGLEWELALVDAVTGDLSQVAGPVLDAIRPADGGPHPNVHAELLRNTVEVVSGVCRTVGEAGTDLARAIEDLRTATDPLGVELMCAGSHPFGRWNDQLVTTSPRYATLIDRTQWWGRQMLIYGVHVHVGVEDRAKVQPLARAMITLQPHLLALSASSPYSGGEDTGYASNRAMLFQQLPTAGLPPDLATWAELEDYVADMLHVGVIDQFDELRWDVRPSPRLGTLEMRICDGSPNLAETLALSALTHCLVERFSTMLDEGRELPTLQPWFVAENKWRAARYGTEAIVITDRGGDEALVTDEVRRLVADLAPEAERLGCAAELAGVLSILETGASSTRQRAVAAASGGSTRAVVASLVAEMRAGHPLPLPAPSAS